MMKRIVLGLMAATLMMACGGDKAQDGEAEATAGPVDSVVRMKTVKQKKPAPKKREPNLWTVSAVESQISSYFAEVNRMAAEDVIDIDMLDDKYCSRDFLTLKRQLEKKIQKGEVMFEGDQGHHWTAGLATPITVDSLTAELLTRDQAQAEVWLIDENQNRGYMELTMYLEDGAWKVHNWIDTDVYPFGALFNWMQNVFDGYTDDEEVDDETENNHIND